MQKQEKDLLAEVQKRVVVPDGMNPVLNYKDAIIIAQKANLLWRYAQNGNMMEVRWSPQYPLEAVPVSHLAVVICQRIVDEVPVSWDELEQEAQADIDAGRVTTYDSADEAIEALDESEWVEFTPAALDLLLENGYNPEDITIEGSGADGKVLKSDVRTFLMELEEDSKKEE